MMTTVTAPASSASNPGWFARTEGWLDDRGKGAWIALMVLGFVFFWPVGLATLFYMIWSKRMFSKSCSSRRMSRSLTTMRSTGNSAFDSYKADTLRRSWKKSKQTLKLSWSVCAMPRTRPSSTSS